MNPITKTIAPALALFLLAACQDSGSGSNSRSRNEINQNEVIAADGSNIDGTYAGELWPVNYNLHFKDVGMTAVQRQGDTFEAFVNMTYAPRGTTLKAAIYTARRCPNINDDLNKDAYIDINEARAAIGKITIPFDGDLDSQMGGQGMYLPSGTDGKYFYRQSASFERMFADLKAIDEDPSDEMVKIGENDGLTFPGRIVLIQGLSTNTPLPETVTGTATESAHAALPVACAVLWKVESLPEQLNRN